MKHNCDQHTRAEGTRAIDAQQIKFCNRSERPHVAPARRSRNGYPQFRIFPCAEYEPYHSPAPIQSRYATTLARGRDPIKAKYAIKA